ncbi:MAG: RNA polymerase sigma factor [Solirubrobacterales bacterium]
MAARRLVALRGDEADLYTRHHRALRRAVAGRVRMSADLIEEACQQAWLILLRRQPVRGPTLFAWLVTVAVHEGYRLSAIDRRDLSLDAPASSAEEWVAGHQGERTVDRDVVDESLEARRALRALASLSGRQRQYAVLRVVGFSYREIAAREGVTYTNVNKHLAKASQRLKAAVERAA